MPLGNRSRRKDILQPFRIFYSLVPASVRSRPRLSHAVSGRYVRNVIALPSIGIAVVSQRARRISSYGAV
jgi:hypothetical protein